ncbi:hypothetical protein I302_108979 [Kwoniella bestiolae CBS 10118]|uniref:NAA35-like N-terminal domain-containing protein n=1 Tax=Kwoniella bestiolae CBS 10118 TaxID=1296100 RepID=A0AAJ8MDP6_9TREE
MQDIDITAWFKDACHDLPQADMVKPPELYMLDAMNAIQMMDSKMDTGATDIETPWSTLVYDPGAHLSAQDICWTMDMMMALEVAWYRGATLCQSVYTALHYHNPHHLAGPSNHPIDEQHSYLIYLVLRAYVLLYCKSIDLAYAEFAKGHVRDGEDCWLDHYGVAVRMSDPVDDVVSLANDALGWLESEECTLSDQWREQITKRMVFRRSSDAAKAAFDHAIPSYLRQNMPLPDFQQPNRVASWNDFKAMIDDLIKVAELVVRKDSWDSWQTRFDLACNQVIDGHYGNDEAVKSVVYHESGSSSAALQTYDEITRSEDLAVKRQMAAWKDLISSRRHIYRIDPAKCGLSHFSRHHGESEQRWEDTYANIRTCRRLHES